MSPATSKKMLPKTRNLYAKYYGRRHNTEMWQRNHFQWANDITNRNNHTTKYARAILGPEEMHDSCTKVRIAFRSQRRESECVTSAKSVDELMEVNAGASSISRMAASGQCTRAGGQACVCMAVASWQQSKVLCRISSDYAYDIARHSLAKRIFLNFEIQYSTAGTRRTRPMQTNWKWLADIMIFRCLRASAEYRCRAPFNGATLVSNQLNLFCKWMRNGARARHSTCWLPAHGNPSQQSRQICMACERAKCHYRKLIQPAAIHAEPKGK